MTERITVTASADYREITEYLKNNTVKNILLVCDSSMPYLRVNEYFLNLENSGQYNIKRFSDFSPNPQYESVVEGIKILKENKSELIIAVGGGSAMDVAKCIKLYSNMNPDINYLKQEIVPNDIKLMAIPTTAGTGSEATRYAVIYYENEKQSVADESCIPEIVIMDASTLRTLPPYQKKATMFDALCHAIESFWSVNSTGESREYSKKAIEMILANKSAYLKNEEAGNEGMLWAANMAGKAINITQTTAGHAMCYKLTSLYQISHGHAAALCVSKLWPYMIDNTDKCIDKRGKEYLDDIFLEIAKAMGESEKHRAVDKLVNIMKELELEAPAVSSESDYEVLRTSVNPVRLKNNPVALDEMAIDSLYHSILAD